ncbi:MAG: hypothetical protein L0Z62_06040 [Gemmataceae bacterium]|nr:hypothetical protein [Gemmataceae bacterium]
MRYLISAAGLLVLLSLLTGVTQVQPGEVAVVRRFGRVLDYRPRPGLYISLPWGIDQVDRVAVDRVRRVTVGYAGESEIIDSVPAGQLLTGDHNLVNIQAVIDYRVNEDEVVEFVTQADRVEGLIARAAETALAEWVAGRTVDEVLLRGKELLPRWLVEQTEARLKPYRIGVVIQHVGVTHLNPPREVGKAFEAVAEAQKDIERKLNEARQKALQGWREAQAEAFHIERLTAAYVYEQVKLAEADATNFERRLAQYRQLSKDNPQYLNALWWDEMSKLYARMRTTGRIDLLDNRLGSGGLDITQMQPPPKKQ